MNIFYPPHSTLKPGARVVAYLRDSGGNHQEESVDRQEDEVRRWCAQYSLTLTTIYTDEARTARHSLHKRKDLLSLMAHLRDGAEVAGVIIWNYERFARNIKHGRHFLAEIEALDKVVCSLTDNIPEGPERYFMQDLKLWSAEQTSVKISIDVTSGLRRMVSEHRGVPGVPPKGFKRGAPIIIGKHRNGEPRIVHAWEPDPDLIPTIRLAFEMRARGATLKQLISTTKLFPAISSWKTFFKNRIYMGILQYGDLIIEDYCVPMVSPELWNQVQAVGVTRSHITRDNNPRRLASSFVLSGLVYCQHCGSLLNGHVIHKKGDRRREYYRCMRKSRRKDCPSRSIPARLLEDAVINQLDDIALDLERLIAFQMRVTEHYKQLSGQAEGERRRLRRELVKQSRRITNLVNAIAERGHSASIITALHKAELEEASLRIEMEHLNQQQPPHEYPRQQLSAMADEIKSALHGDDLQKKKHAIHMLTSRIIVLREDHQVNGVLYYVPTVCIGGSAPTEGHTEVIRFEIPKYIKRIKVTQ